MTTTIDYTALWREDATEEEVIATYQGIINSGDAWRLEGSIGRTAADLIEQGLCVLGLEGHQDYWGNYVPSRDEVQPGTKGSVAFAQEHHPEIHCTDCLPAGPIATSTVRCEEHTLP